MAVDGGGLAATAEHEDGAAVLREEGGFDLALAPMAVHRLRQALRAEELFHERRVRLSILAGAQCVEQDGEGLGGE